MHTATVYLVDDDPAIRDSLTVLIHSSGLNIKTFEFADEFLKAYTPEQTACLILDVKMPIMGGLELQEELTLRNVSIPIIFISGNAEILDSAKAFRAGAVDFLEKPFDSNLLITRIHEALAKDEQARKLSSEKNKILACFNELTSREKEVFQWLTINSNNKEVAKQLAISPRTVEVHRAHIMDKMHTKDIAELVAIAMRYALFPQPD